MARKSTKKTKSVNKSGNKRQKIKTRKRYKIGDKQQAIKLRDEGMSCKQIQNWFKEHLKMEIEKSTLCTWYSKNNVEKFAKLGPLDANNNDTCYNPSQRPRIFIDLETILVVHIKKAQLQGMPMSHQGIRLIALKFFQRLKSLQIYDNTGARRPDALYGFL